MSDGAFDLSMALAQFRADLSEATIPKWRHGQGQFMDQPLHVHVRPRGAPLDMVVAVANTPGYALRIARLRALVPIYAAFLNKAQAAAASDQAVSGADILLIWSASWGHLSSRWAWDGWNPATRAPEQADAELGRSDSWEVDPGRGVPMRHVAMQSREVQIARGTALQDSGNAWKLVDDGAGLQRRIRDANGGQIADFSREEDARYVVAACQLLPTLGGVAERLLEHCNAIGGGMAAQADIDAVVTNADPWTRQYGADGGCPETRR